MQPQSSPCAEVEAEAVPTRLKIQKAKNPKYRYLRQELVEGKPSPAETYHT